MNWLGCTLVSCWQKKRQHIPLERLFVYVRVVPCICASQVTSEIASAYVSRKSNQQWIELLSQLQQCLITAARTYEAEAHRAAVDSHHWHADLQQDTGIAAVSWPPTTGGMCSLLNA